MVDLVSPLEALFLIGEAPHRPMHVGAIQLFEPPPGAGPDFGLDTYRKLLSDNRIDRTFRKRPRSVGGIALPFWRWDEELDLGGHLARWAPAPPGDTEQLLDLVSWLYGRRLPGDRPLWEANVIEGLRGGKLALFMRIHHAVTDGVAGQHVLHRGLDPEPVPEAYGPWHAEPPRPRRGTSPRTGSPGALTALAHAARAARTVLTDAALVRPWETPATMLNVPAGGDRRCELYSCALDRVEAIARAAGASTNDVVLAVTGGALRRYLLRRNALPDRSLVAMVPVSLRSGAEARSSGGVKVAAVLCPLGTDTADPAVRLERIMTAMGRNKEIYRELSATAALALTAALLSPVALAFLPGPMARIAPPFNIVVSSMPVPPGPMHLNGARLTATYPLSIPFDGQALNVTLTIAADHIDFGMVAVRSAVPELDRFPGMLDAALRETEAASLIREGSE